MTEKSFPFSADANGAKEAKNPASQSTIAPGLIEESLVQLFVRFVDFWMFLCTVSWVAVMAFMPEIRVSMSCILVSALCTKIAVRVGWPRLAKYMLVITWTLFLLFAPARANGVITPLVAFMAPYLLLIFWLFGRRAGVRIAILLALIVALYWVTPAQHWIVLYGILQAPISWLVSWGAALVFAHCVWFMFRHYEKFLKRQGELQRQAQAALQRTSEANLELASMSAFNQAILYQSPLPMAVFDADGACIQLNDAYAHLVGIERSSLQNSHNFNFWADSGLGRACRETLSTGQPQIRTLHEPELFGRDLWLDCQVLPINIDNKKHVLLQLADLTERTKAEIALRTSEKAIRTLVDTISSAVVMKDADGRYLLTNIAYQHILGIPEPQILGRTAANFHPIELATKIAEKEKIAMASGSSQIYEGTLESMDGSGTRHFTTTISPLIDSNGRIYGICSVSTDISNLKLLEEELRQLAFHDPLTRLPNRRMLFDRLAHAIEQIERTNDLIAVLFIDLNKFKQLNDMHGHQVGDLLLIEVAERLRLISRKTDTVARLGGDEFVVLLESLGNDYEKATKRAATLAEKISALLSKEYVLGDIHHMGSASVGVKVVTQLDNDPDQIIQDADAAMYQIKKNLNVVSE